MLHDLHLKDAGSAEEVKAGLILRWTYGSAFGIAHSALRHRLSEPAPPPWRWPLDVLATSIATHALYAAAAGYTDRVRPQPASAPTTTAGMLTPA